MKAPRLMNAGVAAIRAVPKARPRSDCEPWDKLLDEGSLLLHNLLELSDFSTQCVQDLFPGPSCFNRRILARAPGKTPPGR